MIKFSTRYCILSIFLLVVVISSSCKKDIKLPDETSKQLFGAWKWVKTDGGIGGGGINTPALAGYDEIIEFSIKGEYKKYRGSTKTETLKFAVTSETSMLTNQLADIISYKKAGLFNSSNQNDFIRQSIEFKLDSLILHEETVDGARLYFIKK
jgi:hypothetical protein